MAARLYYVLNAKTGKLYEYTSLKQAQNHILHNRYTFIILSKKAIDRIKKNKALQTAGALL